MRKLLKPQGIVIHYSATRNTDSFSYDAICEFYKGRG